MFVPEATVFRGLEPGLFSGVHGVESKGWLSAEAGGAGGQDRTSDGKAGTAGIRSSMGRGRGTSSGLFGRQLEAPTPLRSMVTGIAPFSSRLVE